MGTDSNTRSDSALQGLPVIDGEQSCGGDIYGYAQTAEEARKIADEYFVDDIARVELDEWRPGEPAWLVLTVYGAGLVA